MSDSEKMKRASELALADDEVSITEDDIVRRADQDDKCHRSASNIKKRDAQLKLIGWLKWVVGGWLALVLLIVMLSSCCHYSDAVVITLLGTTTVNVLGLFIIALHWLYKPNSSD